MWSLLVLVCAAASPNQQFLVVRKEKAYKKNRNVPAWTMTYYLCNLATGEMSLFIKDNGSWYTDYSIARIFWITGGPELPNADTLERSSSN